MNLPNAPRPSAPSLALWSSKPDFAEEGQNSVAGEDATKPPAPPTNPTAFIGKSQQDLQAGAKSGLDKWVDVGPPEESSNPLPSLTPFVQAVNSSYADVDPNDQTNKESSTDIRGLIEEKTVKHMRLSEALTVSDTTSIHEARGQMAAPRADVLVVTDSSGSLTGILTKKDVETRVISHQIDPVKTSVSKVMTKDPSYVSPDTLVVQALDIMAQGKFKQLPVIKNDKVIGLLRLPYCLFDETEATEMTAETIDNVSEDAVADQSFPIVMDMKRGLTGKQLLPVFCQTVRETTTIYIACFEMGSTVDVAVLIGSNVSFSGILTKKDIVSGVFRNGVNVMDTSVSEVMTKKSIYVCYETLPIKLQQQIVQGEGTQLLVREHGEDGFVYLPLNLKGRVLPTTRTNAEKHKVIDAPQHTSVGPPHESSKPLPGVNANNQRDGANGPGFTPFMHVGPPEQSSNPLPGVIGNYVWDGTTAPGFTPFGHVNHSPYPNDPSDKVVALPPQHTDVRPHEQSSINQLPRLNANDPWHGIDGPSFTPFMHITNSPYPNSSDNLVLVPPPHYPALGQPGQLSNPLPGVNGTNNVSDGTNGPGFTPFGHISNSPYSDEPYDKVASQPLQYTTVRPQEQSTNPLPHVKDSCHDQSINGSSTNIWDTETTTVKQLGVSETVIVTQTTTIYEACCQMATHKADVLVVTDSNTLLMGILTNQDIVSRVIIYGLSFESTLVSEAMSTNILYLMSDSLILDAVQKMADNGKVTKLPVIDDNGKAIGLFDIMENKAAGTMNYDKFIEHKFGIPPRGIKAKQLPLEHALAVPETTTIYEACCLMATGKVGAVVLTESNALLNCVIVKILCRFVYTENIVLYLV